VIANAAHAAKTHAANEWISDNPPLTHENVKSYYNKYAASNKNAVDPRQLGKIMKSRGYEQGRGTDGRFYRAERP
jgi:hypothetical protein